MRLNVLVITSFCLIALLRVAIPVYRNWDNFTEKFDPKMYEKKYNASQYMVPQSKNPISDEDLLSYAGYKYIKGVNPILINSDHPPLGKYIIGLFTVIFNNNRIVSLFFALTNGVFLFSIIILLTHSPLLASLGVLFLSLDPMLIDQIIHSPILDIIQVAFLLQYIFLFILWLKTKRMLFLLLSAITLGCLASTKLYFPAFVVFGVSGLSLLFYKERFWAITQYLATTAPLAFVIYTSTYFKYFIERKAFLPFFGVQKWIYLFWQNNSIDRSKIFANVLPFILFNKWKVWWGDIPYLSYSGWSIIWPVFFILALASSFFFLVLLIKNNMTNKKNVKKPSLASRLAIFLSIWFIFFLIYLCFIPISPRYLMMLYFPSYILVILFLDYLFHHSILYEKEKK